jgi:anti-sigma-K factor RskA
MMNYHHDHLRNLLAGEFALGLLHGAARRRFERLLAGDQGLRTLVGRWQAVLGSLHGAAEAEIPSAEMWSRLQARIKRSERLN